MSTDPVARKAPGHARLHDASHPQPDPTLEDTMRARLRRRVRFPASPPLSVVGHYATSSSVIGHGFDRFPELIMGLTLPSQFDAVSIYASSITATRRRGFGDSTLALGVDRRGHEVVMLADPHGSTTVSSAARGWLIDAARRMVGLATDPACPDPLDLPLAIWLDRVMIEMVERRQPLSWRRATQLCPVPDGWASTEPADLGATIASTTPAWSRLRNDAASGQTIIVAVRPHWARWMDDPMFARWCIGYLPELAELRSDVEFLAPTEVAHAITETIEAAQRHR